MSLLDTQILTTWDKGFGFEEIAEMFDLEVDAVAVVIRSHRNIDSPIAAKNPSEKEKTSSDTTAAGDKMREIFSNHETEIALAMRNIALDDSIDESVRSRMLQYIAEVNLGQKPDKALQNKQFSIDTINGALSAVHEIYKQQISQIEEKKINALVINPDD